MITVNQIKAGDIIRNNDPRTVGVFKEVKVLAVVYGDALKPGEEPFIYYASRTRHARVKLSRIFADGKSRHQGYNLVK